MKSVLKMAADGFIAHVLLTLFPLGVLSSTVNPDTFRISDLDRQIRFEDAAACG